MVAKNLKSIQFFPDFGTSLLLFLLICSEWLEIRWPFTPFNYRTKFVFRISPFEYWTSPVFKWSSYLNWFQSEDETEREDDAKSQNSDWSSSAFGRNPEESRSPGKLNNLT
jgi:hypothetical protein